MNNVIKIDSHIGPGGVNFSAFNKSLNDTAGDLELDIMSPGGSMFDGLQMFAAADNRSKTDKVQPIIKGLAASMGHMMSLSGSELPKVVDYSAILLHKPRLGNDTEGADGYDRKLLSTMMTSAVTAMAAKSGKTVQELEALMSANDGEGTWLTADELVSHGLAQGPPIATKEVNKAAKMEQLKSVYMGLQKKDLLNKSDKMSEKQVAEMTVKMEGLTMELKASKDELTKVTAEKEAANLKVEALETTVLTMKTDKITSVVMAAKDAGKCQEKSVEKLIQLGLQDEELLLDVLEVSTINKEAPDMKLDQSKKDEPTLTLKEMEAQNPAELARIAKDDKKLYAKMVTDNLKSIEAKHKH